MYPTLQDFPPFREVLLAISAGFLVGGTKEFYHRYQLATCAVTNLQERMPLDVHGAFERIETGPGATALPR